MSTGERDGPRRLTRHLHPHRADAASVGSLHDAGDSQTPQVGTRHARADQEDQLATAAHAPEGGRHLSQDEPFAEESFTARLRYLFASRRQRDGSTWTLSAVARATQGRLSLQQVSKLYYGKSANPQLETVEVLAEVFGIEPDYFVRRGALASLKMHDAETYAAIEADPQIAFVSRRMGRMSETDKALLVDVVRRLSEDSVFAHELSDEAKQSVAGFAEAHDDVTGMRRDLLMPSSDQD